MYFRLTLHPSLFLFKSSRLHIQLPCILTFYFLSLCLPSSLLTDWVIYSCTYQHSGPNQDFNFIILCCFSGKIKSLASGITLGLCGMLLSNNFTSAMFVNPQTHFWQSRTFSLHSPAPPFLLEMGHKRSVKESEVNGRSENSSPTLRWSFMEQWSTRQALEDDTPESKLWLCYLLLRPWHVTTL